MAAGGRTPKQRRFDLSAGMALRTNTPRRRRGSCKCLFGAPDRDETRRLMAEQYARERKRFIIRFNFDIETDCTYKSAKFDSPVKFCEEDKENSESPVRMATEALACVSNTELRVLGSPARRSGSSASSSPRTPRTPRTPRAARTPCTPRTPASRRQLQMTGQYWTLLFPSYVINIHWPGATIEAIFHRVIYNLVSILHIQAPCCIMH